MGTARAKAPLILFIAWALLSPNGADGVELNAVFQSESELKDWAAGYYFGGNRIESFVRDGVSVAVVVGRHTSGVRSNEVVIYAKREADYRLVLFMASVPVLLDVEENAAGLALKYLGGTILTLSWDSLNLSDPPRALIR